MRVTQRILAGMNSHAGNSTPVISTTTEAEDFERPSAVISTLCPPAVRQHRRASTTQFSPLGHSKSFEGFYKVKPFTVWLKTL